MKPVEGELMKKTHVLIIGSGTAGPALSLFLKKAGISCAVYEAYPYTEGLGGGLSLAPNGMNVLGARLKIDVLRTDSSREAPI